MPVEIVGIVGILLLLLVLALRIPVGVSMLLVGLVGTVHLVGFQGSVARLGVSPYATASNYALSAIPLFTLMGLILLHSGFGRDLYDVVDTWLGHLRGGMAMATIGACAAFGAVCGSVTATTATMASVALPEMKRYQYKPILSTACVATGGTLGILIPPSIILILYGVLTMEPISKLLIAGILPGILQAFLFILVIYFQVLRNPNLCNIRPKAPAIKKLKSLKNVWVIVLLFFLSIGGIYMGVFTPTEAASVGAFGALLFSLISKRFEGKKFMDALDQSARITAMIFLVVIGATIFGYFLAVARIPMALSNFIAGLEVSRYLVLTFIIAMYFVLGCFMEGIAILVLTVPIIYPLVIELGFNGVWFGVIMIVLINIGLITPPVGMCVYITSGIAKDVSLETIFRGVVPFILAMVVCLVLLIIFPQIVLFLPNLMR